MTTISNSVTYEPDNSLKQGYFNSLELVDDIIRRNQNVQEGILYRLSFPSMVIPDCWVQPLRVHRRN